MSNEVYIINFNENRLRLQITFQDDDYEKASVRFKLLSETHGIHNES